MPQRDAAARPARRAPAEPPERLRRLPSWLLNHLALRANRLVAARIEHGGRRGDYAVLASLEETGPASQAELARRLAIDRGDLVGLLNRLHDERLAERRPDPDDRRRNVVTITAAGRRALAVLERDVEAAQDDLLAPLSAEQRSDLMGLLGQMLDHHHADAGGHERGD
ncbi:MarR family transcriptional regulator [Patulibacter sp. NPDC049589]|uniref:MarR family winged helix-turn-helix transcriptional regulator n=1 Tax=Patulibacter sp. NPDC049589 TaxID=3154731 RepID=UPI0034132BE9